MNIVLKSVLSISILFVGATAFAAEVPSVKDFKPVTTTKTKITCSAEHLSYSTNNGVTEKSEFNGKASESIRVSFDNGVETYRITDSKHFDEDGKVSTTTHTITKYSEEKDGNKLVEIYDNKGFAFMAGDKGISYSTSGTNIAERVGVTKIEYVLEGDKNIQLSIVRDGKSQNAGKVVERTQILEPGKKLEISELVEPYEYETGDSKIKVEKENSVCLYEDLKD